MDFVKYKPLRSAHNYQLFFERPIFDWVGVMPKFFAMIFKDVGAKIPVTVKEFSVSQTSNWGEVQARYSIYGGPSSISLFADKLSADFPILTPLDYGLVRDLMKTVHDGFTAEFRQCVFGRVEVVYNEHLEVLPPHTVKEFLEQHRISAIGNEFGTHGIIEPALRFSVKGTTGAWEYSVMAEQSLIHASALFLSHSLKLNDAIKLPTFEEKVALGIRVEQLALKGLGLEPAHDVGS
jgi:hypothetical protein